MDFTRRKTIEIYKNVRGFEPYTNWLYKLRDKKIQARIEQRVRRLEYGNLGDYKALEAGVFELRLAFGPGYRIYFGQKGSKIIILLCGGNKRTQKQDIISAQSFWSEYQEN